MKLQRHIDDILSIYATVVISAGPKGRRDLKESFERFFMALGWAFVLIIGRFKLAANVN